MRYCLFPIIVLMVSALLAEHQPFDRYQSIVDRQMFGRPPAGFDPTKPANMVQKGEEKEITREQEALKSSIHFSAINVTPDGATAVGFTDNSNGKQPMHYYLKVGEVRDGWKVIEADPVKATMKIEKNDVEVSLTLGANSAKGGGTTLARPMPGAMAQRPGLLGNRLPLPAGEGMGPNRMGSLRERRAARAAEAEKERAVREAEAEKERAAREAEREEQRKELQLLKDELKAQRDAAEADRAAREAERAARESEAEQQNQVDANAENQD